MGFGICAIAAGPKPAQASANSTAATGRATCKTCSADLVGRTTATAPPDAVRPVEANESTGAVGEAGKRREVGNVIASVIDKETDKVVKAASTILKFYHRAPEPSGIYGKMPRFTNPANVFARLL
jgi:hypothetical protein